MLKVQMPATKAQTAMRDVNRSLDDLKQTMPKASSPSKYEDNTMDDEEWESESEDTGMTEQGSSDTVADELYKSVGNAVVLWTNYKAAHWEMVGPRFHELHEQFGEWADEVYNTIDDLAERLRMLDQHPPKSLNEFSQAAEVKPSEADTPDEMLRDAMTSVETVIKCMKEGAAAAQKANDPGSVDLFSKFVQIYEKQRWFIKQFLQPE